MSIAEDNDCVMPITRSWVGAHQNDIDACGYPVCRYCEKTIKVGRGEADHYWPFYDQYSWHYICRKIEMMSDVWLNENDEQGEDE